MSTILESHNPENNRKMPFILAAFGTIMIILAFLMGISDNFPAILLLIIGLCLILYSFVYRIGKQRKLSTPLRLLYWVPRVLCIVFTILISFFALDVFSESKGIGEIILDLFMHLIPIFILIAVLVISWRREWIGGILFISLGFLYIINMWGKFPLVTYILMAGPLIITGILFLLNWKYRAELRPKD
jgi:hypothetical protein